jgi:hypothetical protein
VQIHDKIKDVSCILHDNLNLKVIIFAGDIFLWIGAKTQMFVPANT